MLVGNLAAIFSGAFLTIIISLVENRHFDNSQSDDVWETTRDIDNPLSPWTELYAR